MKLPPVRRTMALSGPVARTPAGTRNIIDARQRTRRSSLGEQSSTAGPALSRLPIERRLMETLTDTLTERVDMLIQARKVPLEWGHPHLSVTPKSLAIPQLAAEIAALEDALREIALEVERLSGQG